MGAHPALSAARRTRSGPSTDDNGVPRRRLLAPRPGPGCPGSTSRTGSSRRRRPRSTSWSRAGTTDLRSRGRHDGRRVATGHGCDPPFRVRGLARPALPRHRRHRLHRRSAGARAARGRLPGARAGPAPASGCATGPGPTTSRSCAADAVGRRRRSAARDGRRRRRLLPDPRAGHGRAFEPTDRDTAPHVRARPRARPASAGSSTWAASPRRPAEELSPHLRSRRRGRRDPAGLAVCRPPCCGAAVIIGSGSASFEMLRYLTERLPAMITPRWVDTRIQPIAIRDVLRYLVGCAALPPRRVSRAFDIGGPDVLTYRRDDAAVRRGGRPPPAAHRPVPVLTPACPSHWVGLVTPVPSSIARPLVESLRARGGVRASTTSPSTCPTRPRGLLGFDRAVELALQRIQDADVATRWSSASVPGAPSDPLPTDPDWAGGSLYDDERRDRSAASPAALWRVIEGIGGEHGWYSFPLAWRVRGLLDRLAGGVGLRRGRRDPDRVLRRRDHRLLAGRGARRRRAAPAARRDAAARAGLAGARGSSPRARRRPDRRRTCSGRCSTPAGCSGTPTGGRSRRSTASCSAGCPATSPRRRAARGRREGHHPDSVLTKRDQTARTGTTLAVLGARRWSAPLSAAR